MAALGASLRRLRPLRSGRVKMVLQPKVLSQLGVGSILRPTQVLVCSVSRCTRQASAFQHTRRRRGRQLAVRAVAMVNVDFASPSLLLGTMLIGCGVLLLNLRNFQNKVSRDADIVVAAMVSIVGSTLIFQGWRLDPLLLLCQALTTSVALWYGMETFRLRSKEAEEPPQLPPGVGPENSPLAEALQQAAAVAAQQQQYYQGGAGYPPAGPGTPYLPPGSESYYSWANGADPASSTSGRVAAPVAVGAGGAATAPYGETIQYDYYGNPIMPQQQQQQQEPAYGGGGYNTYKGSAYGAPPDDRYGGAVGGGGDGLYGNGFFGGAGGAPASASVGYDNRGPPSVPGPSYSSLSASPPSTTAAPPPPSEDGRQPFVSSSGSNSSRGPSGGGSYFGPGSPVVSTMAGIPGWDEGYGPGMGAAAANGSSPWDAVPGPGPGSGAGAGQGGYGGTAAGGRGQGATRLDLYERVDDWE